MTDTTPQIARLVPVDIRSAWAHEAQNFTPWLYANLDALGDAIGILLDGEGLEVNVGNFAADILARNRVDDSRVLIENQLAGSDHAHLGQIMTYLAGLECKTMIWVATDFRDEHLSALKWLNDHTEDGFSFFAVKVKVVRIGDSPFAPIFEVLERPNNWERQLHAAAPPPGTRSELSLRRFQFWQAYVDRVQGELERSGPPSYWSNRWRIIDDPDLIISVYAAAKDVGVFVRAPHYGSHEDILALLSRHQQGIAEKLGAPMGNSDRYHFIISKRGDYNDPAQRADLIDWLREKVDLYERTLREVLGSG